MALSNSQIATLQSQLVQERTRIKSIVDSLTEDMATSQSDESEENGLETHMGDSATNTFLRERDLSIEGHEEQILEEIEQALQRIDDGTYGICVETGEEIPFDRLQALPWATRTVEMETARGH
jgi:RNA polymerase-binding protein DksA